MSILVVGVSHHSAPVSLLERLALDENGVSKLLLAVAGGDHVQEATVLATCNRLEVYTDVDRFHGSVEDICRSLCDGSDQTPEVVLPHLYVHYDDAAITHLFQVAAGLDSMVIGEGQVLGQAREALRLGQEAGTVGPALNAAFQQALRVAKRTHAETDIDRVAPSLVTASLAQAEDFLGPLHSKRAVVIGAGAMASLAVSTLTRSGVNSLTVINRTDEKAERLAALYGASAAPMSAMRDHLAAADLVVSCTGSVGTIIDAKMLADARGTSQASMALIDLALPHDIDPTVAELDGAQLINLARLAASLEAGDTQTPGIEDVRSIVAEEVEAFLSARRLASVTPTVVALRSMATDVVDAELARFGARAPGLDAATRAEVEATVRRVADKLLHQPTVRVKELANEGEAVSYAAALAKLFSLDQTAVAAVTRPEAPRNPGVIR